MRGTLGSSTREIDMIIKLTLNFNYAIETDIIGQLTLNLIKIDDIRHPNDTDVELTIIIENEAQLLTISKIYFG